MGLDCKMWFNFVVYSQVYRCGFWFNLFHKIKIDYVRAGTSWRQEFTCFTGWVKCELIQSEESEICDGVFEGSVIVRLVNKSTVIESGIRDVFFELTRYIVRFLLGPGWGFGFVWCMYVQNIGLVLGLGLVFFEALKFVSMCWNEKNGKLESGT